MSDRRDPRVTFFLIASIVCFALTPFADTDWWVAVVTGSLYALLALAVLLDSRSRSRDRQH